MGDPFGLGEPAPEAHVENFRESEQQHGRVAMTAAFFSISTKAKTHAGSDAATARGITQKSTAGR